MIDRLKAASFSVIIPVRNGEAVISQCLEAVLASDLRPLEVIVVDDGSRDQTPHILRSYPVRTISIDCGTGPQAPRSAGARIARGAVLVFVDADVCVQRHTFRNIIENFRDPGIHAVTGMLSRDGGDSSFWSHYKNEYMNYVFGKQPRESHFLYGSLWAVRREEFIAFRPIVDPFGSLVSDSEMGMRLRAKGKRALLDHRIEVKHLKRYSCFKLIKNDFVIPFMFALMFLRYGALKRVFSGKRFSHASLGQTAATALAFLGTASALWGSVSFGKLPISVSAASLTLFYIFWSPFLIRVGSRGIRFLFETFLFLPIDGATMFAGMASGFLYGLTRPFKTWFLKLSPEHAHTT